MSYNKPLDISMSSRLVTANGSGNIVGQLTWSSENIAWQFGLNLAKLAGYWNSWKSQKNQKVGVFETDLKQVPFVFRQTTCTYSESWGPVENFSDPPKK